MSASYEQLKAKVDELLKKDKEEEREIIRRWILNEVKIKVIPADEGNEEEFIRNLLFLLEKK